MLKHNYNNNMYDVKHTIKIMHIHALSINIQDWTIALAVLVFMIIDIVLLLSSTIITEFLGLSTVTVIPNKVSPRTVTGVCKM